MVLQEVFFEYENQLLKGEKLFIRVAANYSGREFLVEFRFSSRDLHFGALFLIIYLFFELYAVGGNRLVIGRLRALRFALLELSILPSQLRVLLDLSDEFQVGTDQFLVYLFIFAR